MALLTKDDPQYLEIDKNDHIKIRPEMYVGTMQAVTRAVALVCVALQQYYEDLALSPGLLRILIELACNAADNVFESRTRGIPPGTIEFIVGDCITVINGGRPMPVKRMKRADGVLDWAPTVMFSRMFASSHYVDEQQRETAGTYGVGAKMCNTLSTTFTILIRDGVNELKQTWHCMEQSEAVITPCKLPPTVQVSFVPDMTRFVGSVRLQDKPDIVRKIASDVALFARVPVTFRTPTETNVFDFSCNVKGALDMRGATKTISLSTQKHRCWLFISPNQVQESYVNCTPTYSHGKHVDHLVKVVKEALQVKKGFERINRQVLMSKLSFVLCTVADRPQFDGPCKDRLTSKVEEFTWPDLLKEMEANLPELLTAIKRSLDSREYKAIHGAKLKMDGYWPASVKTKRKGGRARRLWLTEGLSAAKLVMDMIMALHGNRESDSILALRGKILNLRKHTAKEIADNKVVSSIVQAMGLVVGEDYSDEQATDRLLVDEVIVASDADEDGCHIRALFIDLLEQLAPSLLHRKQPFVYIMLTPKIRLNYRGKRLAFFTDEEWEAWKSKHPTGWSKKDVKYCKGLGTSGPEEAVDDALRGESTFLKPVLYTENSDAALQLAFDDAMADVRKSWMLGEVELPHDETEGFPIPNMIQQDLRHYSILTLTRAIPEVDGLTRSQRKLVFMALTHGSLKSDAILGKVLEQLNYKHGIDSLYGALVGMVAGYPGSNNLPLFHPEGNFGSRNNLSKNAAASRYTEAKLRRFVRFIFPDEDNPIHEYQSENGVNHEPKLLLPILPLYLVNGARGISTGWTTFIPTYKPEEVIERLCALADGKSIETDSLVPWFRHFRGKVELKTVRDNEEEQDEEGNVWRVKKGEQAFRVTGKKSTHTKDKQRVISISEIPVYMSTKKFADDLCDLTEALKLEDPRDDSGNNTVNITLRTPASVTLTNKQLKLSTTRSLSTMYILGADGVPVHFATPEEGVRYFYKWRIGMYTLRKNAQIQALEKKLAGEKDYRNFLADVLAKRFDPTPPRDVTSRQKYIAWIEHKYSVEAVGRYHVWDTQEKLEELDRDIVKLQEQIQEVKTTSEESMYKRDLANLLRELQVYYTGPDAEIDLLDPAELRKRKK